MVRKLCGYTGRILLLAYSLLIGWTAFSFATDVFNSGSPIQGTPFDQRLRNSGLFDIGVVSPSSPPTVSVDQLFFTARSFRYAPDMGADNWQTPEETEARHSGDCEDKAIWLFTRLKENGYSNVRLVVGRYRSIDNVLHVWVSYMNDEGNTFILDPTIQKRIWNVTNFDSGFYQALYSFDGQNRYRYFTN